MKSNANGLMGDLESIKALLEEGDDLPAWDIAAEPVQEISLEIPHSAELESGDELPAVTLSEPKFFEPEFFEPELSTTPELSSVPASQDASTADTAATAASFDTLLDTDFHDATANVMARARGLIERHPNEWSPQQTDELSDALRVRIDGAVQDWISASLTAHAGELQQSLLTTVRDELARHLEAFETDVDSEAS